MTRLIAGLLLALLAAAGLSLALGEVQLSLTQYRAALFDPASPAAEIVWSLRAPRFACAAAVGAALGLAGAVMQGLLRNPLADPGVLGVSACAALAASVVIAMGLAAVPGLVEAAALIGALLGGLALTGLAARFPEAEVLILFGVGLSSFAGAATALVFNLSPSLVTTADLLNWLMGSVENRSWGDIALALPPFLIGGSLCAYAARGLLVLTLGEESAALSGLPMIRLRMAAVAGAAILTGAAVALAGVIGFIGLAAPHLVRRASGEDPEGVLLPAALSGAVLLSLADILTRVIPSDQELKLGVIAALFGAPFFALAAWRSARSWRS
jgi:iron complex transport system permease protein